MSDWIEAINGNDTKDIIDKAFKLIEDAGSDINKIGDAVNEAIKLISEINNETTLRLTIKGISERAKTPISVIEKQLKQFLETIKVDEIIKKPKLEISNELIAEYERWGFYINNNKYLKLTKDFKRVEISNFIMDVLYLVTTSRSLSYRVVMLLNDENRATNINLNTDDLISSTSFRKAIEREGNYLFYGSDDDLYKLKKLLFGKEKRSKYITTLGHNSKYYAFANGIYHYEKKEFIKANNNGMVDIGTGEEIFIPCNSTMFIQKGDEFVDQKKFNHRESEIGFQEFWENFYLTFGYNGLTGFLFTVAGLFSDHIFEVLGRRFPIMFFYGKPGTGKSTLMESLMYFFGHPREPFILTGSGTDKSFMRMFAQFENAPIALDEYKNTIDRRKIEGCKNIYDRKGYQMAKREHSISNEYVPVKAFAYMAGQEQPTTEIALFERCIILSFTGKGQNKKALEQHNIYREYGFTRYTIELLKHRTVFLDSFYEEYISITTKIIESVKGSPATPRMINNYGVLLATFKILKDKCNYNLVANFADYEKHIIDLLSNKSHILKENDDLSKFFDVIDYLHKRKIIKNGQAFEMAHGVLYLKVQNVYHDYTKLLKERGDNFTISKSTLEDYLISETSIFIEKKKRRFSDGSNSWCLALRYKELMERYKIDLIDMYKPDGKIMSEDEQKEYRLEMEQTETITPF